MARTGGRDEVDIYVGARIGLRRSALGLSQTALAQQLGISFQQVQKYETGQNRISASRLHHAATALGTSVETFFPPVETARASSEDGWQALRLITATVDGRTLAAAFPRIEDRELRKAVARIVRALAPEP
jgi:transcriptional regulator with XRE-family HTH domain